MNKFTIISGYHHAPGQQEQAEWFYELWNRMLPDHFYRIIIANGGCTPPEGHDDTLIGLEGNCGHVHSLIGKQEPAKPHALCGWSSVVLAGAMLCYANETDMLFLEQDCLMFGDCIGQMYRELGSGGMIFGRSKVMPCAQSLFLVKHDFIPLFVLRYLAMPDDRHIDWLPETKFMRLLHDGHGKVIQFSFGYDRERPIDTTDSVWYAQKTTPAELLEWQQRGLLTLPPNMPDVKAFTGDTTGL